MDICMVMMKRLYYSLFFIAFSATLAMAQPIVHHTGAQMKVKQGDFSAAVMLDSLPKEHLFAIGPEEELLSEIFVWDGRIFRAGIVKETGQPYVEKDVVGMKAVFLVWAQVPKWDTVLINDPIPNMEHLEKIIGKQASARSIDTSKPFPFLLFGKIKQGVGHIMNRDPSVLGNTPDVADSAKKYFPINNQKAQFIGFYSHYHQRIFTHHDSYIHLHYRLYTKHHAGHLDEIAFDPAEPVRLLIPTNFDVKGQ
jgi:acetolactate decarboxylase